MQRVIIIFLAVMVSLPLIVKSRMSGIKSAPAAFSVTSSCKVLVRVTGDVRHAGIYEASANSLATSVINMAGIDGSVRRLEQNDAVSRPVVNGTEIYFKIRRDGTGAISVGLMPARERMVLNIPLDINSMNEADFDRLPGIGPVTARRIILYRQKTGGKMRVEDLLAVEGIGKMKYLKLCKYF